MKTPFLTHCLETICDVLARIVTKVLILVFLAALFSANLPEFF